MSYEPTVWKTGDIVSSEKLNKLENSLASEESRAKSEETRLEQLFVTPTQEAVNSYLDAHPEATTTVQDGAITYEKLSTGLKEKCDDVDDLKADLSEVNTALRIVESTNRFNPNTISRGYFIDTNGNIIPNASIYASDFIPCNGRDVFWFARKNSTGVYLTQTAQHLAQYTSDKEFIKRDDWVHSVTLESNCAFIRFDSSLSTIDGDGTVVSVTFNFEPTKGEDIQPWFSPYIYLTADRFDEHVTDVDSFRNEVATLVYPYNLLNLNNVLDDTIISVSGDTANDTCFTTNYFIPAVYGDVVSYAGISASGVFYHTAIKIVSIGMYDSDRNLLGTSGFYKQDFTINQANCAYIRVSIPNTAKNYLKACVTINSIPTPASLTDFEEPYWSAVKPNPSVVRGRRVLWLGTSIPTYGYPQILANLCGARMFNEAIGSSLIAEGIEPNITTANICGIRSIYGLYGLTQTVAEKQTMIDNWTTIASEIGSTDTLTDDIKAVALASSYETIVDPYLTGDNAVDLIVLNHAYNDSTEYAVAPENDKLNPHYLEGAYNWLIKRIVEANPNIGIVIFGHYSDLPTSKETALQNVADRWNIPYYLLKNDLGWSNTQTITTTKKVNSNGEWETITATDMTAQAMWLGDGVHPLGVASKRIAQVSQNVFADWLKMYCDTVN